MIGAFFTHMRMKNTFREYIASVAMLAISSLILLYTFIFKTMKISIIRMIILLVMCALVLAGAIFSYHYNSKDF